MGRRHQFELIQLLRRYFQEQGFLETPTPPMVENPGMETHVHAFRVHAARTGHPTPHYLHTSPEFALKELLADDPSLTKIYSLGYVFRDDPRSPIHRQQFLMLEWYRRDQRYEAIMDDLETLIALCLRDPRARGELQGQKLMRLTMRELWLQTVGVDPLEYLDAPSLRELIATKFPDVPLPATELPWDDLFFLLHLNKVETQLHRWPLLLVSEFPAPLAALSTLNASDPRVCERFEVYARGIELCNAYNELTDPAEQRRRFATQSAEKQTIYGYTLPEPTRFYAALEQGLPVSAGVALGVERLLHALWEMDDGHFFW